jgi:hypothetical protein
MDILLMISPSGFSAADPMYQSSRFLKWPDTRMHVPVPRVGLG